MTTSAIKGRSFHIFYCISALRAFSAMRPLVRLVFFGGHGPPYGRKAGWKPGVRFTGWMAVPQSAALWVSRSGRLRGAAFVGGIGDFRFPISELI
jgi:hypothetical protein